MISLFTATPHFGAKALSGHVGQLSPEVIATQLAAERRENAQLRQRDTTLSTENAILRVLLVTLLKQQGLDPDILAQLLDDPGKLEQLLEHPEPVLAEATRMFLA